MNDTVRDEVRDHYARAALAVLDGGGCCGPAAVADPVFGPGLYDAVRARPAPRGRRRREPRLRQPDRARRPAPGEVVLDLGSGGGIDVLPRGGPRRSDRVRLRPRHDGRDAGARPAQRRGGRRRERPVPRGRDRGDPAARRVGRRRDQQLRRQPLDGEAARLRRDRAGPAAGRPGQHQRHRRRRRAHARRPGRPRRPRRLHRRCALVRGVRRRDGRCRARRDRDRPDPRGRRRDVRRDRARRPARPGSAADGAAAASRAANAALATARALPADGLVPLGDAGTCAPGGSCCG